MITTVLNILFVLIGIVCGIALLAAAIYIVVYVAHRIHMLFAQEEYRIT